MVTLALGRTVALVPVTVPMIRPRAATTIENPNGAERVTSVVFAMCAVPASVPVGPRVNRTASRRHGPSSSGSADT